MVHIGLRILLVCAVLLSTGASPTTRKYLQLGLVPQKLDNWCWAASAEMVKNYLGATPKVQQCGEVNKQKNLDFCCPVPQDPDKRAQCDQVDFPEFAAPQAPDFQSRDTSKTSPPILSWTDIKNEIDAKRPFVHMRRDVNGGGHFVVVRGYGRNQDVRFIRVNDPWPKNQGKVLWQTYDWYSDPALHLSDRYQIEYIGAGE